MVHANFADEAKQKTEQAASAMGEALGGVAEAADEASEAAQRHADKLAEVEKRFEANRQTLSQLRAELKEASNQFGYEFCLVHAKFSDERVVALRESFHKAQSAVMLTGKELKSLRSEAESAGVAEEKLGESSEQASKKTDNLRDSLGEANQRLSLQKSALLLVEAEYKGVGDAAQKFKDINAALSGVMDAQKDKIAILALQLDEAKTKYGETDKRVVSLETALNKEKAELAENAAALKDNKEKLGELGNKSSEAAEKSHKLKDALGAVGKAAAVAGAAVGAAALAIGKALTDAVTKTVESGVAYNKAMETYRAGFSTLLGDARAGEALLAEIAQFAADTPFELPGLANSAQTLLSFGVSSEAVMDDLKMLGDISMGSQEKLNGLAVVFGQVASAGKLNGQDLNQMISNGFNPLNIIAEQTGVSMSVLRDKMADGAISFDMVSEAMKIATSEGGLFYNAMEAQSATLEGQLATLNDDFNALAGSITGNLVAAVTNEALPALNQLVAAIDALVAGNENAEEMLESASQAISDAVGNMIPVVMEILGTFGEIGLELINTLAKSISDNQDALIQTAMTLIDGLIEGITSVLDVLLPIAAALLGKLVEGLVKALPTLVNGSIMLIGALGQAIIDNLPLLLKAAIQIVAELAKGLAEAMPTLIPAIVKMITDMVQTLVDNAPLLLEAALALIEGLATGLINSLPVLIDALPELIDGIIKFTVESLPMIVDAGVRLFTALIGALPEIIQLIVPAIPRIINGIITAVVASTSAIIDAGVKLFVALVESLPVIIEEIVKAVPDIIDGIVKGFESFRENIATIGKNLLVNIWNGMVAYQGWMQEQISGFFQGIVDTIGDIFSGKKTFVGSFGVADEIKNDTPGAVAAAKERNAAMIAESKRY